MRFPYIAQSRTKGLEPLTQSICQETYWCSTFIFGDQTCLCVNVYLIFDPGWMFSPCDRLICTNKTCFSGVGTSEENNFSECLAPNQIELMNSLKPCEARFQSCARFFFGGVSREI